MSTTQLFAACAVLALLAFWSYSLTTATASYDLPFANVDKKQYIKDARQLLIDGARKFAGPFTVLTDSGPLIMLPPEQIDAVNAESHLSFQAFVREEFMANFDTFRTMRTPPPGMFEEAVIKGITRALPKFTKPLSLEMEACLSDTWGARKDWHEVKVMDDVLVWVARLSNAIFLGDRFSRNKDWLRITTTFTINLFMAIGTTKIFHPALRRVVDFLSPLNRKVRRDFRLAAAILKPVLKERNDEILTAQREGRKPELPDDSIEWFRNAAHGRDYSDVDLQLALAVAAIHTTSDLLCQAILNFCAYPECQEALRAEAASVLGTHGLQKVALTELRLLDSFLKETQRLKPVGMASMHRSAEADVTLPGGIKIKKGQHTAISSQRMWDDTVYPNPDSFDAFRYVERRKIPGQENKSLLVSTSADHLGFSHGKHACTGRFFAANEVKIAMLHLFLEYDMEIGNPNDAKWQSYGTAMFCKPGVKIRIRRREPEIDLEVLANAL